jgi:hypothetical protein
MLCKFSLLVCIATFGSHTSHIIEVEMDALLVGLHYMINIFHATPLYHVMPTLLVIKFYTSQHSVKTENLLLNQLL